jgi:release factor glutamine methyltransferase
MTTPPPDEPVDGATLTWHQLQREAIRRLTDAGLPGPEIDARRIIQAASGLEGAELVVGLSAAATVRGVSALDRMVERRITGEPLQYVLGSWGFRTLDLLVDRRVLIPRPETEQVVGWALDEIDRLRAVVTGRPLVAVDLGTGSGAIALSIVAERERIEVWATDVSSGALDVARANLAGLGRPATRVRLVEGSWFDALPAELMGCIDVVVSNPPYVAVTDALPTEVADWEPPGALVSGPTGLESLLPLVALAPRWLARPGALVVELAPHQAESVREAAMVAGFDEAAIADDFTGRHRAVVARLA